MSAKRAINGKLQGSVATYLKCGMVVTNQVKKSILLTESKKIKSVKIRQIYKNVVVSCTLYAWLIGQRKCTRQSRSCL